MDKADEARIRTLEAEVFALRFLLGTLFDMVILQEREPLKMSDTLAQACKAGFEASISSPGARVPSQFFSHAALHLVEIFFDEQKAALLDRLAGENARFQKRGPSGDA